MSEIYALLDNSLSSSGQASSYFFDVHQEIKVTNSDSIQEGIAQIEALSLAGYHLVGFFSYELGATLLNVKAHKEVSTPLMWFYAFKSRQDLNNEEVVSLLKSKGLNDKETPLFNFQQSETKENYVNKIDKIKQILRAGDSYQINYTMDISFQYQNNPISLYAALRKQQQVEYGAFLNFPNYKVLSFSPELFLRKRESFLMSKPMKGTMARAGIWEKDELSQKKLANDEKIRSENLMIVDLIRNDLGIISNPGTVEVESLFNVETYQTVFQMTSLIKGEIPKQLSVLEAMKAMFPCGSITGAPKKRTMEWINNLEDRPRGLYTGSIGYFEPNGDYVLNVAIRTVEIDKEGDGRMGIGGGILYDSDADQEYEECLTKANFLKKVNSSFYLIETFLFDGSEFKNIEVHLARLKKSCQFFGFSFFESKIKNNLLKIKQENKNRKLKVRIEHKHGAFNIRSETFNEESTISTVAISDYKVASDDVFQAHKTSIRSLYDAEYNKYLDRGADEVLFFNERNELVEASRHNIFLKKNNQWYTPPLNCGALPGVGRGAFINSSSAIEEKLYIEDLKKADEILLVNSLRGSTRVRLI